MASFQETINRELLWFLVAGMCAIGTDLGCYFILNYFIPFFVAKGISFILGSILAFIINKFKTFKKSKISHLEILNFIMLYLSTLGLNIIVNEYVLFLFPGWVLIAFFCATGTSTVINYLGQKYWVFK